MSTSFNSWPNKEAKSVVRSHVLGHSMFFSVLFLYHLVGIIQVVIIIIRGRQVDSCTENIHSDVGVQWDFMYSLS